MANPIPFIERAAQLAKEVAPPAKAGKPPIVSQNERAINSRLLGHRLQSSPQKCALPVDKTSVSLATRAARIIQCGLRFPKSARRTGKS